MRMLKAGRSEYGKCCRERWHLNYSSKCEIDVNKAKRLNGRKIFPSGTNMYFFFFFKLKSINSLPELRNTPYSKMAAILVFFCLLAN